MVVQCHQKTSHSKTSNYLESMLVLLFSFPFFFFCFFFFLIFIISFTSKTGSIYGLCNLELSWSKITLHFISSYPSWLEKEFFHEIACLLAVQFLSKTSHLSFFPLSNTFSFSFNITNLCPSVDCSLKFRMQCGKMSYRFSKQHTKF